MLKNAKPANTMPTQTKLCVPKWIMSQPAKAVPTVIPRLEKETNKLFANSDVSCVN